MLTKLTKKDKERAKMSSKPRIRPYQSNIYKENSSNSHRKEGSMDSKRLFSFLLVLALLFVISMPLVEAASNPVTNGFERIGEWFKNAEYKENSQLIDFFLYFVLFFSLVWLGLGNWFGKNDDNKGAIIGLSFALAIIFALALSSKLPIMHLFVVGKVFLFIVFTLLLYGLLSNSLIGNDTTTKKIISFLLAAMIAYLLFTLLTFTVCKFESPETDECSAGPMNSFYSWGERVSGGDWSGAPFYSKYVQSGIGGGSNSGSLTSLQCEGGTRIDLLFPESDKRFTHKSEVKSFLSKIEPTDSIYLYSFSQKEDEAQLNARSAVFAVERQEVVQEQLEKLIQKDSKFSSSKPVVNAQVPGPTTLFSNFAKSKGDNVNDGFNVRVILSTKPIGDFVPFPAKNTVVICGGIDVLKQCSDGRDNDGDGKADFNGANGMPKDEDCESADDDSENSLGGSCAEAVESSRENNFNFLIELDKAQGEYNDIRNRWEEIEQLCSRESPGSKDHNQSLGHYYYYQAAWAYKTGVTCSQKVLAIPFLEKAITYDSDVLGWARESLRDIEQEKDTCGLPVTVCNDHIDNDNDGNIDFKGSGSVPADPDCESYADESEDEDSIFGPLGKIPMWAWLLLLLLLLLFLRNLFLKKKKKDLASRLEQIAKKTLEAAKLKNEGYEEEKPETTVINIINFITLVLKYEVHIKNLNLNVFVNGDYDVANKFLIFFSLDKLNQLIIKLEEILSKDLSVNNITILIQNGAITQEEGDRRLHVRELVLILLEWVKKWRNHVPEPTVEVDGLVIIDPLLAHKKRIHGNTTARKPVFVNRSKYPGLLNKWLSEEEHLFISELFGSKSALTYSQLRKKADEFSAALSEEWLQKLLEAEKIDENRLADAREARTYLEEISDWIESNKDNFQSKNYLRDIPFEISKKFRDSNPKICEKNATHNAMKWAMSTKSNDMDKGWGEINRNEFSPEAQITANQLLGLVKTNSNGDLALNLARELSSALADFDYIEELRRYAFVEHGSHSMAKGEDIVYPKRSLITEDMYENYTTTYPMVLKVLLPWLEKHAGDFK